MLTRTAIKNAKNKKPLETTLGKASFINHSEHSVDLSHVRKPIDTSIFGLRQALSLFETATEEVRQYITYECDIMYECRICRTIYRSLANFILHKRNYCPELYNPNDHTNCRNNCQENGVYVHQEDSYMATSNSEKQESRENSPVFEKNIAQKEVKETRNKRKLNSVLDDLLRKQESALITKQGLEEDTSSDSKQSDEEMKNTITLQMINDTSSSAFQSLFPSTVDENGKNDLMKTQVMEIYDILENNEAIIGYNGKIITPNNDNSSILKNFACTVCNQKFSTRKTLNYHVKYKHNNSRLIYRCPECSDTFATTWSVFRHLYKIHRKTVAQVKKLRNQIHRNVIRRNEQPISKEDNSIKTITDTIPLDFEGKLLSENKQWMADFEGANDLQRCSGCGKKYERKAALHSHSQFCNKRIALCNAIKDNTIKMPQMEEKMEKSAKTSKIGVPEISARKLHRRKPTVSQKTCQMDISEDEQDITENYTEICKDKPNEENCSEINAEDSTNEKSDQISTDYKNDLVTEIKDEVQNCTIISPIESSNNNNEHCTSTGNCNTIPDITYVSTAPSTTLTENDNDNNNCDPLNGEGIAEHLQLNSEYNSENNINDSDKPLKIDSSSLECLQSYTEFNDHNYYSELLNSRTLQLDDEQKQNSDIHTGIKQTSTEEESTELLTSENSETSTPANDVQRKFKITLETKSMKYIDNKKQMCRSCNRTFKSYKSLMKHMAVHFNWYRYECRICSYVSYSKSKCRWHVQTAHSNCDNLKDVVVRLSSTKAISISTDFIKCSNNQNVYESIEHSDKQDVDSPNIHTATGIPEDEAQQQQLPIGEDTSLRKMIMEVIFGSEPSQSESQVQATNTSENTCDTEETSQARSSCETSNCNLENPVTLQPDSQTIPYAISKDQRPIRNRITPVHKDFLYDMTEILKQDSEFYKAKNKKKKYGKLKIKKAKLKIKNVLHNSDDNNEITELKNDQSTV